MRRYLRICQHERRYMQAQTEDKPLTQQLYLCAVCKHGLCVCVCVCNLKSAPNKEYFYLVVAARELWC